MGLIYLATNIINNKKYVGLTTQTLEKRMEQHKNSINIKNLKNRTFPKAIREHGFESFKFEVIEEVEDSKLNSREKYWIKYYNTVVDNGMGYNSTYGGEFFGNHTEQTKKKISESQKGEKNHMYGRKGSKSPSSKKVLDLIELKEYNSVKECSDILGLNPSKVAAVCRGARGSTGNKIFYYIDNDGNLLDKKFNTSKKSVLIYSEVHNKLYYSLLEYTIKNNLDIGSEEMSKMFSRSDNPNVLKLNNDVIRKVSESELIKIYNIERCNDYRKLS